MRKLKGDASSRAYFRFADGSQSVVVMAMPQDAGKSEEISSRGAPRSVEK